MFQESTFANSLLARRMCRIASVSRTAFFVRYVLQLSIGNSVGADLLYKFFIYIRNYVNGLAFRLCDYSVSNEMDGKLKMLHCER